MGVFVGDAAHALARVFGVAAEKSGDFGLRLQMTARETLQSVLDHRGEGLTPLDCCAFPLRPFLAVLITVGQLQAPVTIEAAPAHAADSLLGVLAAVLTRKRGLDDFEKIVFGIVGEGAFGRNQLAASGGDGIANGEMGADAAGKAIEIIDDNHGFAFALLEESKGIPQSVTIGGLAGEVVTEHGQHLDVLTVHEFPAGRFLRFEAVAIVHLPLVRHAAIDDAFCD